MHQHQPVLKATARARYPTRRPIDKGEPLLRLREEALPARTALDWPGAAVLGTALLVGTGLVMLIQLVPSLRQVLG